MKKTLAFVFIALVISAKPFSPIEKHYQKMSVDAIAKNAFRCGQLFTLEAAFEAMETTESKDPTVAMQAADKAYRDAGCSVFDEFVNQEMPAR